MLTVINVCTNAIDDLDAAVEEITSQLQDKTILKNAVGIIGCHSDYIEGGITKALSEALPFDIIGCTVFANAINGQGGTEQLTLTIFTSDDVTFATAFSEPLSSDNIDTPIENAYTEALNKLGNKPDLIMPLVPVMVDVHGNQILKKLDSLSGGVPVFGTLSNDTSSEYATCRIFKNGDIRQYGMALLLLYGNIKPRFYTTAIATKSIQLQNAVVTDSEGYLVKKINDLSVLDYFATQGIQPTRLAAITMRPFLVDFRDGTPPVSYGFYKTSEAGAYCGGEIPKGAAIAFTDVDYGKVMETAEITLRAALDDVEKNGANGIFAIPCMCRALIISPSVEDEITKSLELIGNKIPFSLLYSGGEICPMYNQQLGIVNRFHNLTYTLMVF